MLCLYYYDDILNYFWSKVDVRMTRNFGFWLILRRYYKSIGRYRQRISFTGFVRRRWWHNRRAIEVFFRRTLENIEETQLEYSVFGQYLNWAHSEYKCKRLRLYQPPQNVCCMSAIESSLKYLLNFNPYFNWRIKFTLHAVVFCVLQ